MDTPPGPTVSSVSWRTASTSSAAATFLSRPLRRLPSRPNDLSGTCGTVPTLTTVASALPLPQRPRAPSWRMTIRPLWRTSVKQRVKFKVKSLPPHSCPKLRCAALESLDLHRAGMAAPTSPARPDCHLRSTGSWYVPPLSIPGYPFAHNYLFSGMSARAWRWPSSLCSCMVFVDSQIHINASLQCRIDFCRFHFCVLAP